MNSHLLAAGGPAFPTERETAEGGTESFVGITVRDYFAAAALQGKLATRPMTAPEDYARWAYRFADAMLAERCK